jgi:PPOX class probable F420-dependent enzyme
VRIPRDKTLIESGCPAHLVTLNRDGSPQLTLVWVGVDGDELVAGHLSKHQKVKNVLRDPRIAVSLQATTKSALGLTEYAVLYGEATSRRAGRRSFSKSLGRFTLGTA